MIISINLIWGDICQKIIKYDGKNITISGLNGVNEAIDFNIGEIKIKNELLQTACDIAQIYDLYRYSNCQKIKLFSKNSPQRDKFILEVHKNEQRLIEFLILIRLASSKPAKEIEKAIAEWISFIYSKRIREESPIITEDVRSGE